jgi:predicted trehalose synthase
MEALTAIALIANIVQFVELGAKLISSAKEMQASASGMTTENKSLEEATTEMRDLAMRLDSPTIEAKSDDGRALRCLAKQCRELSEQIIGLLKKIAPTSFNSRLRTIGSAMKNQKYRREKKELEEKLASCHGQLHLHFSRLTKLVHISTTSFDTPLIHG